MQTLKMALKKKFQNNRVHILELQKALQQFLFHYRITPHLAVGMSPAERMFSRKLRTRLTMLLVANKSEANQNNNYKKLDNTREFHEGDRVECRNYYGAIKWAFGRIEKRIGLLHYLVRLDNGNYWKRHVDQIQKIGDITLGRQSTKEMWDYNPPETEAPTEKDKRKEVEQPQEPGKSSEAKEEVAKQGARMKKRGENTREIPEQTSPQKSSRSRAPPNRYGKQITH